MRLLLNWVLSALAVWIVSHVVPGISVSGPTAALIAALAIGFINATVGALLKVLTFPLTVLTLGLFWFVINAAMVLGIAWIVNQAKDTLTIGFTVGHFPAQWGYETIGCAVVASIVISVVGTVLNLVLVPRKVVGL